MRKTVGLLAALLFLASTSEAQETELSVSRIMQDYRTWVGAWPSEPFWSEDGRYLYFRWNPRGEFPADSLFKVPRTGGEPVQVSPEERRRGGPYFRGWRHGERIYDRGFGRRLYEHEGDIYVYDRRTHTRRPFTQTLTRASNPRFSADDRYVFYRSDNNIFRIDIETGALRQMTDLRSGEEPSDPERDEQQEFLHRQQRELLGVIRERQDRREATEEAVRRDREARGVPSTFYFDDRTVSRVEIDPTGRFVAVTLMQPPADRRMTAIHDYVAEDGFATDLPARPKVGSPAPEYTFHLQDLQQDTIFQVDLHTIEGAFDVPAYLLEQGVERDTAETRRGLVPHGPYWSRDGRFATLIILADDNKDRWIVRLHPERGEVSVLDRQTDDAWIGGPGIHGRWSPGDVGWLPDDRRFYFQSERTGYSHLYTVDVETGRVQQLTRGAFEVFNPQISRDGNVWYFTSSEVSPFERHFYRMPIGGGERTRLTFQTGGNDVFLAPDEETLGKLSSYSNRPPEVYLRDLRSPQDTTLRVTESPTEDWLSYDWRDPEIIWFEASDGHRVPARLYEPETPNGAAVLFVHGAGYLQNVHRWWSTYFREYMFHNLLADLGYVVLDVDFRASAGYGRDWRTAIYRHMGGRDLQDFVDSSRYLTAERGIPPGRIGIYGGSYGGFITLMALFTEPAYFGAGAALRSVTDWAHYNHGYTSNILNTPATDSLAFARSSPINFAEGLEAPLLITHGVVDANVQFQDVVRLAQRLIELEKEDWEIALFPVEDHGFVEPSSWHDQYRRILKLFEDHLHENGVLPLPGTGETLE